jgi:hypothetical protein
MSLIRPVRRSTQGYGIHADASRSLTSRDVTDMKKRKGPSLSVHFSSNPESLSPRAPEPSEPKQRPSSSSLSSLSTAGSVVDRSEQSHRKPWSHVRKSLFSHPTGESSPQTSPTFNRSPSANIASPAEHLPRPLTYKRSLSAGGAEAIKEMSKILSPTSDDDDSSARRALTSSDIFSSLLKIENLVEQEP